MSDDGCVWVRTAPSVSGKTYVVSVEYSEDLVVSLNRSEARDYANTVIAASTAARHDAAVYMQLVESGVDDNLAAGVVASLRADRAPVGRVLPVFELRPGVGNHGPFLVVLLAGEAAGQWTPAQAETHATGVLASVAAADLDQAYYRALRGSVGLEEEPARNAVAALARRVNTDPVAEELARIGSYLVDDMWAHHNDCAVVGDATGKRDCNCGLLNVLNELQVRAS